jgi:hypothetical protein
LPPEPHEVSEAPVSQKPAPSTQPEQEIVPPVTFNDTAGDAMPLATTCI